MSCFIEWRGGKDNDAVSARQSLEKQEQVPVYQTASSYHLRPCVSHRSVGGVSIHPSTYHFSVLCFVNNQRTFVIWLPRLSRTDIIIWEHSNMISHTSSS